MQTPLPPHFQALFSLFCVIWVGGGGFLVFRYPEFFAKINARFGMKWASSPRFIALTKIMGIVEMSLAGLSAVLFLVGLAFGWSKL